MQKSCPWEVDTPTYHFRVQINFGIHNIQWNGLEPFHYYDAQQDISNNLLSDPNGDRMQKLCALEIDVPTYHFMVHKMVSILSYNFMFSVHLTQMNGVGLFHYCISR